MSQSGTIKLHELSAGYWPDITFWNTEIYVYGSDFTRGGSGWCTIDRDLQAATKPVMFENKNWICVDVAAEPIGESGEDRSRIFTGSKQGLFFAIPGVTKRNSIVVPFPGDPNQSWCAAGGRKGLYLVASGAGFGLDFTVFQWSWDELTKRKPPRRITYTVPKKYRDPRGNYGQRAAVAVDGNDDVLVVGFNGEHPALAEISPHFTEAPTWTKLPGVMRFFDVHHLPDGHVNALCDAKGLGVWSRDKAGHWTDKGDPSKGHLPRPFGCSAVCFPRKSPVGSFERVILVTSKKKSTELHYWRDQMQPFGSGDVVLGAG